MPSPLVLSNPLQDVGCDVRYRVRVVEFISTAFQWSDVPFDESFVKIEEGADMLSRVHRAC